MIINHNMASLNTYRQLSTNTANTAKSLEKLSSGLRINKAGDDAAGLAISEKMRGQIRGLDQAARNSQDGISMIQTAEGSLNETHAILQRMKELATQASNDTNVGGDRGEIQKELNQLSSEINRIGNTTEFNTQSLLKGDGKVAVAKSEFIVDGKLTTGGGAAASTVEATQISTLTDDLNAALDTATFDLNGQTLVVTLAAQAAGGEADSTGYNVTSNAATVNLDAAAGAGTANGTASGIRDALTKMIDANAALKGNYTVSGAGANITITAVKDGDFAGAAGNIGAAVFSRASATDGGVDVGTTTNATQAYGDIDLAAVATQADAIGLIGKGMTINGTAIEFYDADEGTYTGNAQGINISEAINAADGSNADALAKAIATQAKIDGVTLSSTAADTLTITASVAGAEGKDLEYSDGGIQKEFKATFQVGANKGQSFTIDINDMRSEALGVTAKAGTTGFAAANTVTDGTTAVEKEAALDVSDHTKATAAIAVIDSAIGKVSAERSKLGAFTNRLEHTIANLGTSSENMTAAESRIRDVDMAKEMMQFQKNNILAQAATAMLAQANQQPQGVLQLLR